MLSARLIIQHIISKSIGFHLKTYVGMCLTTNCLSIGTYTSYKPHKLRHSHNNFIGSSSNYATESTQLFNTYTLYTLPTVYTISFKFILSFSPNRLIFGCADIGLRRTLSYLKDRNFMRLKFV